MKLNLISRNANRLTAKEPRVISARGQRELSGKLLSLEEEVHEQWEALSPEHKALATFLHEEGQRQGKPYGEWGFFI